MNLEAGDSSSSGHKRDWLVPHPLRATEWPIIWFLNFVLGFQTLLWLAILLSWAVPETTVIRQVVSVVYLLFFPGLACLRALRIHGLDNLRALIYSVGLSIGVVVATGLAVNFLLPLLGVTRPMTLVPMAVALTLVIGVLCLVAWWRDRHFGEPVYASVRVLLSPGVLGLCIIPPLTAIGALLVTYQITNIAMMAALAAIALVALLVSFKWFPSSLYALAVFSMALGLAWHFSLVSPYLFGADIHDEYYVANLVIQNGVWNPDFAHVYNTSLAVTILAPAFSILGDISLTWVAKVVFQIILGLVPLALYVPYRDQFGARIAVLGCFFLIALGPFYIHLPQLLRQTVGTFFIALVFAEIFNSQSSLRRSRLLILMFGMGIVFSHYYLAFQFLIIVVAAAFLIALARSGAGRAFESWLSRLNPWKSGINSEPVQQPAPARILALYFIPFFAALTFLWYFFVADAMVMEAVFRLFASFRQNVGIDITVPTVDVPITETVRNLIMLRYYVTRLVHYLIIIGVIFFLLGRGKWRANAEFTAFSVIALGMFMSTIVLPLTGGRPLLEQVTGATFDLWRLQYFSLLWLTPYCLVSAFAVAEFVTRYLKLKAFTYIADNWRPLVAGLLVIFFLYEVSFVGQLIGGIQGSSPVLNQEWFRRSGTPEQRAFLWSLHAPEQDMATGEWLAAHRQPDRLIYATYSSLLVPSLTDNMISRDDVRRLNTEASPSPDDYIYLQYTNVVGGMATDFVRAGRVGSFLVTSPLEEISHLWEGRNLVYANGGARVYK